MYRRTANPGTVVRVSDGAHIPTGGGNYLSDAYEAWLAEGNEPEPAPLPEPPPPRALSPLEFMERLTKAERIAIRRASRQNDDLADWLDMLLGAREVNVTDPRTVAGVQALVQAGLLTPERAAALLAP